MANPTRKSRLLPVLVAGALTAGLAAETVAQDRLTMALTGDSIITRKLSVYEEPEFLRMIDLLRGADLAFTNVEVLFHDWESYPMSSSGGTYMRAQPELVQEFVWAGIDIGSLANNHSGDYGPPAMLLTEKYIREAGIVAAGIGRSLAEAREAKFIETKDGRVAVISLASTYPDHSVAGKSRDDIPARPGLNPLRFRTTYEVTREQLEGVRATMRDLKMNPPASGDSLSFLRNRFELADAPGVRTEPHPEDMAEIAMIVSNARRQADHVMVTIHAHEGAPGPNSRMEPAQFLVTFARAMVDAGASVFVGHGPHALRAIEIYKGAPILYSLGDFIFQNETLQRLPYENYYRLGLGGERRPRRLQRGPLQQRHHRVPGDPRDLGGGHRRPRVERTATRRIDPPPDHPRVWPAAPRPRPADVRRGRTRRQDPAGPGAALGAVRHPVRHPGRRRPGGAAHGNDRRPGVGDPRLTAPTLPGTPPVPGRALGSVLFRSARAHRQPCRGAG